MFIPGNSPTSTSSTILSSRSLTPTEISSSPVSRPAITPSKPTTAKPASSKNKSPSTATATPPSTSNSPPLLHLQRFEARGLRCCKHEPVEEMRSLSSRFLLVEPVEFTALQADCFAPGPIDQIVRRLYPNHLARSSVQCDAWK